MSCIQVRWEYTTEAKQIDKPITADARLVTTPEQKPMPRKQSYFSTIQVSSSILLFKAKFTKTLVAPPILLEEEDSEQKHVRSICYRIDILRQSVSENVKEKSK